MNKEKLNGERLYQTNYVKYFRGLVDTKITKKNQINNIAVKVNKENAMLSKKKKKINEKKLHRHKNNFKINLSCNT